MKFDQFRKSLSEGYLSLKSWFAIFGLFAAIVSASNFVISVFNIGTHEFFEIVLNTYRGIFHGVINLILFPLKIKLPPYAKDLVVIYFLIGGSFLRARRAEGSIYLDGDNCSVKNAFLALLFGREPGNTKSLYSGRGYLMYQYSPTWMRQTLDVLIWQRVLIQYWNRPRVFRNEYNGSIQSFSATYTPGGIKTFLYDRRVIFLVQALAVILGVIGVIVVNGFLGLWV